MMLPFTFATISSTTRTFASVFASAATAGKEPPSDNTQHAAVTHTLEDICSYYVRPRWVISSGFSVTFRRTNGGPESTPAPPGGRGFRPDHLSRRPRRF